MTADRIALIGPYTWDLLAPALAAASRNYGLATEVVSYGFGRDAAIWSLSDPDFERNPPQGAFVFQDARQLFHEHFANPRAPFSPNERGRAAAAFVVECLQRVADKFPAISWVLATIEAPSPGPGDGVSDPAMDPISVAVEAFNVEILAATRKRAGWSVVAQERLSRQYGHAVLKDARLDMLARIPMSVAGGRLLAERLAAHWAAVRGKGKKVLALDCDNTLWGGIVGEDGVNGIQLGPDGVGRAYAEFQRALLFLESRGTLLVLCSRNNPNDIRDVLVNRPEMLIREELIAAQSIGWGRKSDGLRSLAATLGLGLDSFVFIDDNPVEREEIRQSLPEVAVPDFPIDPADLASFGYELAWRYFYRLSLSDEDRHRTEHYHARAELTSARQTAGDSVEFLSSLQMTSRVRCNSVSLVNRNAQLSQKTNQFNLTLRRYTENDVSEMMASPGTLVFSGSLADRFCEHGWVALAIMRLAKTGEGWKLDSFLVSCRVLGRGFEHEFAAQCIDHVRLLSNQPVLAEYIPGPKNSQTSRFLDELGFQLIAEAPDGRRDYALPVETSVERSAFHITFTWE